MLYNPPEHQNALQGSKRGDVEGVVIMMFYPVVSVTLAKRNPDKMAAADCACQLLSVRLDHWSFLGRTSSSSFLEHIETILFPWGEWPQVCPGKKLAEVEEVAVLACLFRTHRLGIMKTYDGDSDGAVRKRSQKCGNGIDLEILVGVGDRDQVTPLCSIV